MTLSGPVLAVIAARGGSKGLPGKNVLPLSGLPMIAWTVRAGLAAKRINRLIVSTDDLAIAEAARNAGCEVPFLRPAYLATDEASIEDALFHALDTLGGSWAAIVLLQATSPFRQAQDIDGAIGMLESTGAPSVVTVTPTAKPPHWMYTLDVSGHMVPVLERASNLNRRQDAPPVYVPNGAVYVARLPWLRDNKRFYGPDTCAYVMPPERSADIDTPLDFAYAQALLASGLVEPSKELQP